MRGIAKLLFGDEAGKLLDMFSTGDTSDGDGFGMAERSRRSGEWCGTTPGRGRAAGAARGAARPRRVQRQDVFRNFRTW